MKKILFLLVLLTSCTGFQDSMKDIESNTLGLKREIKVYSLTGEPITSYSGNNVRVEFNEYGRVLSDGNITMYERELLKEEK